MKEAFPKDRLFWIEQASGSTFGFPDLIVPMGLEIGQGADRWCRTFPFPLELKVGEMKEDQISYELRPAQMKFLRMAQAINMPCAVVVGQKDSEWLFIVPNGERARGGEIDLDWFNGDAFLSCSISRKGAVEAAIKAMWNNLTGRWPGD